MFRSLKIKLILINLSLVGLILLLLFSGLYALMSYTMGKQSERILTSVARGEPFQWNPRRMPRHTPPSFYFYVKLNTNGQITEFSRDLPISEEHAAKLAEEASSRREYQGILTLSDQTYRYLKADKAGYRILVFVDIQPEKDILAGLVVASLVVGFVSLLLVFFISIFLASKALVPVRKAWQKQKNFIADASHELRTPLAVIGTNLEVVLGNSAETVESQMKWLVNIREECGRMTGLVNDMLFLARHDAHEEPPLMAEFDVTAALRKTVALFEPMAEKSGIMLLSDLEPQVFLHGAEEGIARLAAILLDNAIKHTPRGGRITVRLRKTEGTVGIEVSDTGEGIAPELLDKIFERFYRVDKARSRSQGGSGLGLAIARCIAEEHKGTIHVSSVVNEGSTFTVVLPAK